MFFSSYGYFTQHENTVHCVKTVRIRSYSGPYFQVFGLNNSEYGHFLRSGHLYSKR